LNKARALILTIKLKKSELEITFRPIILSSTLYVQYVKLRNYLIFIILFPPNFYNTKQLT